MRDRIIGPDTESRPFGACEAHGCLLPGVYTNSIAGSSTWFCAVHDNLPVTAWQEATRRIHDRAHLFRLSTKLLHSAPGDAIPDSLRDALRLRGLSKIADLEVKTCRQLGYAIKQKIVNECRPDVPPTVKWETRGSLLNVSALLAELRNDP